jgi:preprotein translocase subunit SecG
MYNFLVFIEIVTSILLIAVVLLQSSKGTGLAGGLGGGTMGTVFGVRRTSDFLSKSTAYLAGFFLLLSLFINIFFLGDSTSRVESIIQKGTANGTPVASAPHASAPAATPIKK